MELKDVIRVRRAQLDLTLDQVAEACGVGKSIVSKWERGDITNLRRDSLVALADVLRVSPLVVIGREEPPEALDIPKGCEPMPKTHKIPLLGTIACGEPILAEENLDGEIDVPDFVHADFALLCKGDSMIGAGIQGGDAVYIRTQPDVEDGEIAAVLIEDEATLKRVYKIPGRIQLRPENPVYPVMDFSGEELDEIRILGKAVGFTHLF